MLQTRFPISLLSSMLLFTCTGVYSTQAPDAQSSSQASPKYPESADGLKNLVGDIFAAVSVDERDRLSSLSSDLAIPDHSAWFAKVFGTEEGARIDANYQRMLPKLDETVRDTFKFAKKMGVTNFRVQESRRSADAGLASPGSFVLNAMRDPVTLYSVDGVGPEDKNPTYIGEFFYVAGGFRYVHSNVFQGLSTAIPTRVRIGGNLLQGLLVHKVDPPYPREAVLSHTEGTVVLHVVIAVDGSVKDVQLVSGDPALTAVSIAAVRQWRYKPTKLNGELVEVDSTVAVVFSLR